MVFAVCVAEADRPKPDAHSSSGTHPFLPGARLCLLALSHKQCFVRTAAEQDEFLYLSLACVVLIVISCWCSISGGETPQWKSRKKSVLKHWNRRMENYFTNSSCR